ncbi:FMR1-interacting protein NUFIP1-like [Paramacrobiotus metropolitanus]|uniref:FMR1-interacting protein NUFIP1-like n=1 Tax=Paramacrobiotus metropolitanus TaxID=2943436 RepID=UPI002445DA83|nr:FMR1-interacting protein NUFIP1-like [Paramacrobiotus metropolitanus]
MVMDRSLWNPFRDPSTPGIVGNLGNEVTPRVHHSLHSSYRGGRPARTVMGKFGPSSVAPPHHSAQMRAPSSFHVSHQPYPVPFQPNFFSHRPRGMMPLRGGFAPSPMRGRGGQQRFLSYHSNSGNRFRGPQPFRSAGSAIFCDVCEKDFRSRAQFDEHMGKHLKCPKCDFVGVFESVEVHFEIVHLSALVNKNKPEETPEDLKRWREERARRYPRVMKCAQSASRAPALIAHASSDVGELSDGEIDDSEVKDQEAPSSLNGLASLSTYLDSESDSEPPEELPAKFEKRADPPVSCNLVPVAAPIDVEGDVRSQLQRYIGVPKRLPKVKAEFSTFLSEHGVPMRKPRTLFEKLVLKDLQTENDQILQCIAHLCNKH